MSATPVKKVPIHLQSSQNRLLIKNGKIVNADGVSDGDIFIEDGVIKELGRNLIIPGGTRTLDARGKYIFPGGIDPHAHLEAEFGGYNVTDDYYRGTKAAVAGGTTTVINFIIPKKGESLLEFYADQRALADEKVCCDYGFHVAVISAGDKFKEEMAELVKEDYGVNSFKFFMAYKDVLMLKDPDLFEYFELCRKIGALALVHAENGDVIAENAKRLLEAGVTGPEGHQLSRPEDVEAEAVTRAAMIANQVSCPLYVVHVMSRSAAEAVALARSRGNVVFGETLAAAVGTDGRAYNHQCFEHAAGHVLSPPLRPDPDTPDSLLKFLSSNGLQLTGSDHCTFTAEQKARGKNDFTLIPNGVNGIEERMSVLWERGVKSGILDLPRFVEVTSTNAAKIFGLYPRKGLIAAGSDADIVIWNPNEKRTISAKTHHTGSDFNVFEGMDIHGAPEYVIVNGRVCVDEFELKAVQGHGRFIPRLPWTPHVYEQIIKREEKVGIVERAPIKLAPLPLTPVNVSTNDAPATNGSAHTPLNTIHETSMTPSQIGVGAAAHSGRQMRQEGQRDLQGTTFSITGENDAYTPKSSIKVNNPPGGRSSGGFW